MLQLQLRATDDSEEVLVISFFQLAFSAKTSEVPEDIWPLFR